MHNGKEIKKTQLPANWQNFEDDSHFCLTHNTFSMQTGNVQI